MKAGTVKKSLEATAYHEAAHAVACHVLKRKFQHVTIVPDGDSLGRVRTAKLRESFDPDAVLSRRDRDTLENEIIIFLVAAIAEGKFTGRDLFAKYTDTHEAIDLATFACGSPEEAGAYVDWLRVRAKNLILFPRNFHAVKQLAAALLQHETIGYRKARAIMREALQNPPSRDQEDWSHWK